MKSRVINFAHEISQTDVPELSEAEYDSLIKCDEQGLEVEIVCLSCEGSFGYYDIVTPHGVKINGLDGYHLSTIHAIRDMMKG